MWKKIFIPLLVIGISFALLATNETRAEEKKSRPDYENAITTAREMIWKAITSGQGSGATIAIMDQGKIVYSEGIGVADRSKNRLVDRNTRFNIGSSSKMFAAVAVLLLVDDGKVVLDESVVKYIPEFKMKDERYKRITVRMLFNHSSGLPGSSFYFGFKPDTHAHKILLDTLKDIHLKHDPGAMSIYCNDGFTLAEMIVERMSGKKYIDFLTERVFNPLGMKNSSASVGGISEMNVAEYYDPKTGRKYPRQAVHVLGAGGLASTAEDLCRFGDSFSLKGKRILSDASIKEILKAQPTRFSDKLRDRQRFGQFGWEYSNLPDYEKRGIQALGKGGNTQFYNANLQIIPQERIAIGFVISGGASGEVVTRPILNALMKDKGLMEGKAKTVNKPAAPQPVPPGMLKYAGYYIDGNGAVKIAFDKARKALIVSQVVAKETGKDKPGPSKSFVYHDDYFYDDQEGIKYYFTTVDGNDFFISHGKPLPFEIDMILYQKIAMIRKPVRLRENINGTVWLLRNAPPYMQSPVTAFSSSAYEELPGYVDFDGIKKIETDNFASIAATAFRDQTELLLFTGQGKTWAKSGFFLFSKADGIPRVKGGSTSIKIGNDNYNEWLILEKGALLSFEKPENGRIIVSNKDAVLFDSSIDSGEIYAPAESYVFCAGTKGDIFRIRAK
jgi:CubicO group peptidase (beta-lactamase class C family)